MQRLTASANNIPSFQLTARIEEETLSRLWRTYRMEAMGRLVMPAQG